MLSKDIGIDLGTANVLIYIKDEGIVLNEPNVVVINKKDNSIVAIGEEAKNMLGKTPRDIKVIRPMKNGVIADLELTELMLEKFIKKVKGNKSILRPRVLICCPSSITEVEKNALVETVRETGARKIYIEEEAKMAAIGAGIKISKSTGNMVVDIGGGTTDIAVLSLDDIVISKSIPIAGNSFTEEIIKYIRENYEILVGEPTAEKIKCEFANCYNIKSKKEYKVKGRNLITGLPQTITITEKDTEKALNNIVKKIIKEIQNILEKTPPELSSDIIDTGIVLTGGGSLLKGLREKLTEELKVPVLIASSPLTCVIDGTKILLKDVKKLNSIA